jgi:ubiquinone/menaquinone biosynthesis C-methylase UbiE
MNLEEINKNWTSLGEQDPMWAILTDPEKVGNRWQEDEFFETGRQQIKQILSELEAAGISIVRGKSLDFGCGIGRLTQAFSEHFKSVDGVDISSSMISNAQKLNRFADRAIYHLNVRNDLSLFPSNQYDFVFSWIVLQHMPRALQQNYIAEFFRLLKPGGVAYFQTIHTQGWRSCVPDWAADFYRKLKHKGKPFIPLYGIPVESARKIIENAGGIIEKYETSSFSDQPSRFKSDIYCVRKQA